MKKLLLIITTVFIGLTISAKTVTFDFTISNAYDMIAQSGNSSTYEKDGKTFIEEDVTITINKDTGNGGRLWSTASGYEFRLMKNSSLTFNAENISKIEFITSDYKNLTYNSQAFTSNIWVGNSNSIIIGSTNTTKITSIIVTYGEDLEEPVVPPIEEESDLTSTSFNFTNPASLTPSYNISDINTSTGLSVEGITFTNGIISVKFSEKLASTPTRFWNKSGSISVRIYTKSTFEVHVDNYHPIYKIVLTVESGSFNLTTNTGTFSNGTWTMNDLIDTVIFTATGTTYITSIDIYFDITTGVEDIISDSISVEYYNLQGVKINNPTNGFYIVKQRNKISKTIIK